MKRESYYVCMCDEAFDIAETLQMIMGSCMIMCIHKEQIKTLQQQLKEHTEYLFFLPYDQIALHPYFQNMAKTHAISVITSCNLFMLLDAALALNSTSLSLQQITNQLIANGRESIQVLNDGGV